MEIQERPRSNVRLERVLFTRNRLFRDDINWLRSKNGPRPTVWFESW